MNPNLSLGELAKLSLDYMMSKDEWNYDIRNSYRDGYAGWF